MQTSPAPRRSVIEAVVASTIGTTIEWYDFFLYGTAAATVFPELFFPSDDAFIAQLLAFGSFSIAFVARPIGGVIFGYLGDRVGRKSALVSTLLLMGVSTVFIGFLPTYAQIGLAAPILLTLMRVFQGLGVGGEWGGAVLMALEYGNTGRRGFFASWPQAGVPLGSLTSTGVMALCRALLSREDFMAWGWRIPFLLSGLLIAVGLFIRMRVLETPLFRELKESNQLADAPVRETIVKHWRELLLVAGSRMAENASFYLFTIWIIQYAGARYGIPESVMFLAITIAAAVEFATIPLFGIISDRWTRRRTYMAGCVFLALFAGPFFALIETREPMWIVLAVTTALAVGHGSLYSVQAALIPELFSTRLRCTAASIGYQLGAMFAGGLAPIIAAALARANPDTYWPVAGYIIAMALFSLVCVQRLAETHRRNLSEE